MERRRPRLPLFLGLAVLTALAHVLFVAAHLALHVGLAIPIGPLDALVWGLVATGPMVAIALPLRAGRPRLGAALLAAMMVAALAWGLYAHYAMLGPDAVAMQDPDVWGRVYAITSQMLVAFELQGLAVGAMLLVKPEVPRPAHAPSA
jgi:hypothetical protein